jgi:hypothetical protein
MNKLHAVQCEKCSDFVVVFKRPQFATNLFTISYKGVLMFLSHQTGVRFPIALPLQNGFPDEEKALRGFPSPLVPVLKSTEYPLDLRKCDSAVIVKGRKIIAWIWFSIPRPAAVTSTRSDY